MCTGACRAAALCRIPFRAAAAQRHCVEDRAAQRLCVNDALAGSDVIARRGTIPTTRGLDAMLQNALGNITEGECCCLKVSTDLSWGSRGSGPRASP
eukprot:11320850-Heterocapsa_arctica.AAC.1